MADEPRSLAPVARIVDVREQDAAKALAELSRALTGARERLDELLAYRAEYFAQLHARGADGIGAAQLQGFQLFLAQLATAIEQQRGQVERAGQRYQDQRQRYLDTRRQAKAVDKVVERHRKRARYRETRREQAASDERAQHMRGRSDEPER